jgi:hypothetical protein
LNSSDATLVTITVYDNFGNTLEGAQVKLLKYDVLTNSFLLNTQVATNFEGRTVVPIVLNSEYYKFIIEYDGDTVLSTSPTYIYGTSLSFYVTLSVNALNEYLGSYGLNGAINYSTSASTAYFIWNDETNTATNACLKVYTRSGSSKTLTNSTCTPSPAGTNYLYVPNSSGAYYLEGVVTRGGSDYTIAFYTIDGITYVPGDDDGNGFFYMAVIVIVAAFIGFWSLEVAIVLATLAQLIFSLTGLVSIPVGISAGVFVLGLVTAYIIGGNK